MSCFFPVFVSLTFFTETSWAMRPRPDLHGRPETHVTGARASHGTGTCAGPGPGTSHVSSEFWVICPVIIFVGSNKKGGVPQEPMRIKKCLALIHQVATDINIGSTVQAWQNRPTQLGLCRLTKNYQQLKKKLFKIVLGSNFHLLFHWISHITWSKNHEKTSHTKPMAWTPTIRVLGPDGSSAHGQVARNLVPATCSISADRLVICQISFEPHLDSLMCEKRSQLDMDRIWLFLKVCVWRSPCHRCFFGRTQWFFANSMFRNNQDGDG